MEYFAQGLETPECPILLPDGDLLCVEMRRASVTRIDATSREARVVKRTGGFPNGLVREASGRLWIGEVQERALILIDAEGAELDRITSCGAERFRWPNDLAIGPDGALYVTDSGLVLSEASGADWSTIAIDGCVYRVDRQSREVRRLDRGLRFTNGLAFGSDRMLYVAETISGNIYRYDVLGGPMPERELFGNVFGPEKPGGMVGPDGMKFGTDGRLYCTVFGQGRIVVFDPAGAVVGEIRTAGSSPTNLAFSEDGSRKIYVTELSVGAIETHPAPCDGLPLFR